MLATVPRIPGYRLLRPIGRGRNTRAWLAFDLNRRADVVLKLEAAPGTSLERDCAVAGRVQGPNLVRIHSQGRTAAWAYLAMEHLPGGDLGIVVAIQPPVHVTKVRQSRSAGRVQ